MDVFEKTLYDALLTVMGRVWQNLPPQSGGSVAPTQPGVHAVPAKQAA